MILKFWGRYPQRGRVVHFGVFPQEYGTFLAFGYKEFEDFMCLMPWNKRSTLPNKSLWGRKLGDWLGEDNLGFTYWLGDRQE